MKNWLKIHQVLLAILLFAILAQVIVYFLVLSPKGEELEDLKSDVDKLQERLRGSNWPLDAQKLERYLGALEKEYKGSQKDSALTARSAEALRQANATFLQKISSEYGNVEEFMSNVSRLDYQSEFNRVTTSLAEKGIVLDASVLNLNEDMPTPYIYQCMMQIWTVEKLVELALDSNVTLATLPERRRGQGRVAKISVEPMLAYFLSPQNEQPYLLEFPVKLSIEGTLETCMGFIDRLTGDGIFMPPRNFEIFALPPANNEAGEDGLFKSGSLCVNLTCPSYLVIGKVN